MISVIEVTDLVRRRCLKYMKDDGVEIAFAEMSKANHAEIVLKLSDDSSFDVAAMKAKYERLFHDKGGDYTFTVLPKSTFYSPPLCTYIIWQKAG